MPVFCGSAGSRANSTVPASFSYGPASPKDLPLSTDSRRSMRNRTTRACGATATSITKIITRTPIRLTMFRLRVARIVNHQGTLRSFARLQIRATIAPEETMLIRPTRRRMMVTLGAAIVSVPLLSAFDELPETDPTGEGPAYKAGAPEKDDLL